MNLHKTRRSHRESGLGRPVRRVGPAALLVLALLGLGDELLHQSRQLLLGDVLAAEALLQGGVAVVQSAGADEAGDVHHAP